MGIRRIIWTICVCVVLTSVESALGPALAMMGIPPPGGGGGGNQTDYYRAVRRGTLGGLYGAFQTLIVDDSFNFIDSLLGHAHSDSGDAGTTAAPLGYAASRTAMIDDALAAAEPASRFDGWRTWSSATYTHDHIDGGAANPGIKSTAWNGVTAIDRVNGDWMIGLAGALGRYGVMQERTGDSAHIDAWRAGGYVSYRPGNWTFTAAAAQSLESIGTSRLGTNAAFDARSTSAGLEAAYKIGIGSATLQPMAGAIYTRLSTDGFVESGTTGFEVNANSSDAQSLRSFLGARLYSRFALGDMILIPELRGRVFEDFLSMQRRISGTFVGDPTQSFVATGPEAPRTAVRLGGALEGRFGPAWLAAVSYDAEARGQTVSHIVSGKFRALW